VSRRLSLAALALAAVAAAARADAPAPAPAANDAFPFKITETTLANGLNLVVIPYDSPGTVAYFTLVRVGSRDEVEPGHTGFAHFFEHMMFRGTEKYPADRYNDVLKEMGADSNAETTDDYTMYHTIGPTSHLATIVDMEADRFRNLKYSEEDFRTEALAILGEYNKNAASPFLALEEKTRGLAFTRHTYAHTALGFLADIKAMPGYYEYSRRFFDRFYRPETCTVVVVGDVEPAAVRALVEKSYGDWQKGYKPADITAEPPQHAARSGHVDWPSPIQPVWAAGFHAPAWSDRSVDSAAIDVLGQLLFGEAAPLYQELVVDKQWVDLLVGGEDPHRDPTLFSVIARVKSPDLVPKVAAAIQQALAAMQAQPVDPARLERTVAHVRNAFTLSLSTPGDVAKQICLLLALTGDVHALERGFAQYARVTPADVQRLARAIFDTGNETIVTLTGPAQPAAPAGAAKPQGDADHAKHD
jgi:zinc protease